MERKIWALNIEDLDEALPLLPSSYTDFEQTMDAEIHSPNEMMVDPDDYVVELPQNEKDDVAIINPDQLDGMDDVVTRPRADDCRQPLFSYIYPRF